MIPPTRYEDLRCALPPAEAREGAIATFAGRLAAPRVIRARRRGPAIVRARLIGEDEGEGEAGSLDAVWFGRSWLAGRLQRLQEMERVRLHGPVRRKGSRLELLNPTFDFPAEGAEAASVAPVYPAVAGLGPAALARIVQGVLESMDPRSIEDPLIPELLERHGLPPLGEALAAVHRPGPEADVEALNSRRTPAQARLAYGELLEQQVALALRRARREREPRQRVYRVDETLGERLRGLAPFPLTGAQERAVAEVLGDLASPHPMLRLLQGDVGSGKTIVAALALAAALENGHQAAFMAPTEILAEQHFASLAPILAPLLGGGWDLGLFTASTPGLPELRRRLAAGEVRLAVGTHALLQESVEFRELALAVIDEQHRFGVAQRSLLREKGRRPDLLVMTATPIPRSLALTAWGDLPISRLDEMPPGRKPVATEVVPARERRRAYAELRSALAGDGRAARAYVVVPLIEESGSVDAVSLKSTAERVRKLLGEEVPIAELHGRMKREERERAMAAFARGEVRVLVATTVVEVGIDVPEATWMVIESAERFGLAQLHQLRGRVGRGGAPGRCVAIHGRSTEAAARRLAVFAATADGFEIAEADLAIRGPGELLGTRQAGLPALRAARLPEDREWLERAREDAAELLGRLGSLSEPELNRLIDRWAPGPAAESLEG